MASRVNRPNGHRWIQFCDIKWDAVSKRTIQPEMGLNRLGFWHDAFHLHQNRGKDNTDISRDPAPPRCCLGGCRAWCYDGVRGLRCYGLSHYESAQQDPTKAWAPEVATSVAKHAGYQGDRAQRQTPRACRLCVAWQLTKSGKRALLASYQRARGPCPDTRSKTRSTNRQLEAKPEAAGIGRCRQTRQKKWLNRQ